MTKLMWEFVFVCVVAGICSAQNAGNCSTNAFPQKFVPGLIIQGKSSLGLEGVRGISYSIGYSVIDSVQHVQASTPADQACKVQLAKIVNKFGVPVPPSADGAQAAVRGTNFNDVSQQSCAGFGLCANVWDGNEKDVYPLSTLTYVVVATKIPPGQCPKMRVVHDYIKWILTSSEASQIAKSEGFATMPKKVGELAVKQVLDIITCESMEGNYLVKDEPVPSQALIAKGSGSSLQEVLQGELLHAYTGSGVSKIIYDGSLGSGGGLCQVTVGSSSCWFNKTSKETVACAVWDPPKTTCLKAAPPTQRTLFAGSDSILEMTSRTVQQQGQRMIPVFAAAIGLIHNLPIPDLVLSRFIANAIFLGQIVRWDDPALLETNPVAPLPPRQIIRIVRADKSGTTEAFARALASFANVNYTWGRTGYWSKHPLLGSSLPTWPVASTAGLSAEECVLEHCSRAVCSVGQWHDSAQDLCHACPRGSHQDSRGQYPACIPCAPGSFADAEGAAVCEKCGEAWYQNAFGQTACLRCPANTRRFLIEFPDDPSNGSLVAAHRRGGAAAGPVVTYRYEESPGVDVDECKCLAGFWLPASLINYTRPPLDGAESPYVDLTGGYSTARGGEACELCPDGGICPGYQHNVQTIPATRDGYWGDPSHPGVLFECKSAKTCYKGYHCGKGHMGAMCLEPLRGYFTVGHLWYFPCPGGQGSSSATALTVLVTAAVVYVWLQIMNLAEGSVYDSLDVGVKFLHLVGFVAQFPLRWHPKLDPVFLVLLVANLEVDFISPHCVWPSFTGVTLFYFQLVVPFIIVGVASTYWALVTRRARRLTLEDAKREPLLNKMRIRDGTIVTNDPATYIIKMSLQVFGFMYQVLAFRCFSVFTCRSHPRRNFLKFYPDVECKSPEHQTMMAIAIIYAAVILVAAPLTVLAMLLRARRDNQLTSPEFSMRFGVFYEQFKVDYVWWELAMILRKLCISLILALVSVPMIQGGLAVLLIYLSIIAHVAARPLQEERNNLLEGVCLFCALAFVCCGMIFYPSLSSSADCVGTEVDAAACSGSMSIKEYFSVGLMILVAGTFALSVLFALSEMYERHLATLSADRIEEVRKWFLSLDRSEKKRNRRSSLRHGRIDLGQVRRSITGVTSGIRRSFSLGPQTPHPESSGPSPAGNLSGESEQWGYSGGSQSDWRLERAASGGREGGRDSDVDSSLDLSRVQSLPAVALSPRSGGIPQPRSSDDLHAVEASGPGGSGSGLRLRLSHMLDGFFLSNWRLWLKEMERQDQNIRAKYRCNNPLSQLHDQERAFLRVDDALPATACKVVKSLGSVANSTMGSHCRALLAAFPGVIDYLATAPAPARRGLFHFLKAYLSYSKTRPTFRATGPTGEARRMVGRKAEGREAVLQEEYCSMLLDWLMHAPPPQVNDFRLFIDTLSGAAGRRMSRHASLARGSVLDFFSLLQGGDDDDGIMMMDDDDPRCDSDRPVELVLPVHKRSKSAVAESIISAAATAAGGGGSGGEANTKWSAARAAVWRPSEEGGPPTSGRCDQGQLTGRTEQPTLTSRTDQALPTARITADMVEIVSPRRPPSPGPSFQEPFLRLSSNPRHLIPPPRTDAQDGPAWVPVVHAGDGGDLVPGVEWAGGGLAGGPMDVREMSVEAAVLRLPTPRRLAAGPGSADAEAACEIIGSTPLRFPGPRLHPVVPTALQLNGHPNGHPDGFANGQANGTRPLVLALPRLYDSEATRSYGARLPPPSESPRPDLAPVVPIRPSAQARRLEFAGPPQNRWPNAPLLSAAPAVLN